MKKNVFVAVLITLMSAYLYSEVRQYPEDSFFLSADQALNDRVDEVARLNNFTTPYEIAIPKNPALQMNVWNRSLALSNNPTTGNLVLVINPSWFSTLSAEEQKALLSVNFQSFKDTSYWYYTKVYLPYIQMLISFIMILLLMRVVRRIKYLAQYPRYYGIIAAVLINGVLQNTVIKKTLDAFNDGVIAAYYGKLFVRRSLDLTHNKQAMISGYEKLLAYVEQSLKDGEKNLEAYRDAYAQRIKWLNYQQ